MKMVFSIISSDDTDITVAALNKNGFYVTELASTGGFLKKGNSSLLIGVEDEKAEEVCGIIRKHAGKRSEHNLTYVDPSASFLGSNSVFSDPTQIQVGGAVIFVLNVEEFQKC